MSLWKVIRLIREEYEVEAETRKSALNRASDPSRVVVVKETCSRVRDKRVEEA